MEIEIEIGRENMCIMSRIIEHENKLKRKGGNGLGYEKKDGNKLR